MCTSEVCSSDCWQTSRATAPKRSTGPTPATGSNTPQRRACSTKWLRLVSGTHPAINPGASTGIATKASSCRLEAAARQLRESPEMSVTNVALSCDSNSSQYFPNAFRRAFGATPSASTQPRGRKRQTGRRFNRSALVHGGSRHQPPPRPQFHGAGSTVRRCGCERHDGVVSPDEHSQLVTWRMGQSLIASCPCVRTPSPNHIPSGENES